MHISADEIAIFYRLHPALLLYVNNRYKTYPELSSLEKFMEESSEKQRFNIRTVLTNNIELIDDFVSENINNFSRDEIDIIKSWKNFIAGDFHIVKFLKDYAVFLNGNDKEPKAYGVRALHTPFEELVPFTPIMVNAVLLPFRGKIIYDGIMSYHRISFGSGMKGSIIESYNIAKAKHGIITDLTTGIQKSSVSDEEMLRFYLKNEANRERYSDEIHEMISKDNSLTRIYHQEIGKSDARYYGKRLRGIGMEPGWYAILEGIIVASGETPDDVAHVIERLVPNHKIDFVYYYQLKRTKAKDD